MRRSWIPGLMVILVGVIYLLSRNDTSGRSGRWWALFIALGAVWFFERAWARYRAGIPLAQMVGLITSGLTILTIAVVLFLGAPFGRVWPVFIIIAGVGSILRTRR
jgi:hypothetical protein